MKQPNRVTARSYWAGIRGLTPLGPPGRGCPPAPRLLPRPAMRLPPITPALKRFALEVHAELGALYGTPVPFFQTLDPLSELVSSLLSHRTKNRQSGAAFRILRERFPTWQQVIDADAAAVIEAIKPCTWPELKGPRLQAILRQIQQERGELSLEFLTDWPVPAARAWLERIPGVGRKTSACVLLFSTLRKPALPVDSHHHRVAMRLGLVPAGCPLDAAHDRLAALLPPDWDAQSVYDHHELLMFHGQRCCSPAKPACERCPLADRCPSSRLAPVAAPRALAVERPAPSLFDTPE